MSKNPVYTIRTLKMTTLQLIFNYEKHNIFLCDE
jgi:hypothetical protein